MNADGRGHADLLKKAFLAIADLEAKLAALERAPKEPIAIVGMACRFPAGADDPEAFFGKTKGDFFGCHFDLVQVEKGQWGSLERLNWDKNLGNIDLTQIKVKRQMDVRKL